MGTLLWIIAGSFTVMLIAPPLLFVYLSLEPHLARRHAGVAAMASFADYAINEMRAPNAAGPGPTSGQVVDFVGPARKSIQDREPIRET